MAFLGLPCLVVCRPSLPCLVEEKTEKFKSNSSRPKKVAIVQLFRLAEGQKAPGRGTKGPQSPALKSGFGCISRSALDWQMAKFGFE